MRGLAGEKTLLKRLNRAAILRSVWENPGISRSGVAERMGVTKSTVSQAVTELEAEGWLSSGGSADASSLPGRPSIPLSLNAERIALVGVEVGFETINALAVDPYGRVLAHAQAQGDTRLSVALERVKTVLCDVRRSPELLERCLLGVGVGVPGPVEVRQGLVLHAPNLNWRNVPLRQLLSEQNPDLPRVHVDNDANLAVFAEYMFGAHRHSADLLYLYLGEGIGGGLILGHQLYRGQRGFAGEIGHITLVPNGKKCSCGNRGCAETLCSWRAVRLELARQFGGEVRLEQVLTALESGDDGVKRVVATAGRSLGVFLSNLANIFDPKVLIVGGPLADLERHVLEPALEEMHRRLFGDEFRNVHLEPCAFGENACAIGAAGYAFHALLQNNTADLPSLGRSSVRELTHR
jgi:predicted NBD/HSP70 family sugar kinase